MTGNEIVPGIEDRDDWFAHELVIVEAELFVAGAVTEAPLGVGCEEAVAAKVFGLPAWARIRHMDIGDELSLHPGRFF